MLIIIVFSLDLVVAIREKALEERNTDPVTPMARILIWQVKTGRFWVDFISALPIFWFFGIWFNDSTIILLQGLHLLKLGRVWREIIYSNQTEDLKLTIRLINTIVYLLVYIHFTACMFYYIASIDKEWIPEMSRFREHTPE